MIQHFRESRAKIISKESRPKAPKRPAIDVKGLKGADLLAVLGLNKS